ncbi:MAG TPA: tetratricopeptide repeat protein [Acidobacteriaceae bacterium]|jgi:tetratricopeptide (TPR) repeat protein
MFWNTRQLRAIFIGLALGPFPFFAPQASAADLGASQRALLQGRAAEAINSLRGILAANPADGPAHLLLCRAFYAEELPDQSVSECEAALRTLGGNSEAQHWAGKAYGLKADRSGPLTGYSMAKKVKASFEAAVNLDPMNGDAVDDLGEYYVAAPSIVGGGLDKAEALAARVEAKLPERALRLRALIAEKRKDYGTAEREFREHVQLSHGRDDTWLDLGSYYSRRKDYDKAADALRNAYTSNHGKDASLLGVATALDTLGRDSALAIQALQDYLAGGHWDDSAPTFRAHTLLAKFLAARGDKATAKIELNQALALAPDYDPAKKALAAL